MRLKYVQNFQIDIIVLATFILISPCYTKGPFVDCPIQWQVAGEGFVPPNSLTCSDGTSGYIARVFHEDTAIWISGRVEPSLGKALFAHEGSVLEFSVYQVLVVPIYCDVSWVPMKENALPDFAVRVDQGNDNLFVGRVSDHSQNVCGKVDLAESSIIAVNSDNGVITRRYFEVVISTFPEIFAEIRDFRFDLSQLHNSKARQELIGAEILILDIPVSPGSSTSHKIRHNKLSTERFSLEEIPFNWEGIANVSFNFANFFGTSDVSATIQIRDDDVEVTTTRDRHLQIDTVHEVIRPAGNSVPITKIEVCSVALVVDDVEFSYDATIIYKSGRLQAPQILEVLQKLGRPQQVIGSISGILRGRFFINTALHIENPDPNLICSKYR